MKIESKTGKAAYPASNIYGFIADFRNFDNFIPADKVSDWQAETDHCSFRIDMLGKVRLTIHEKEEGKLVKIISDPTVSQYNFNLWIQFKEVAENDTRIKVTIEPLINQVLKAMVKSPLKSFVDSLIDEIEKFEFPDQ
ncbi:MAG: hypothetical protein WD577_14410 [Bacteroidales bacterium]